MGKIKKYKIIWSPNFKIELERILYYISNVLVEPRIAKKLYNKIIEQLASLQFFPERFAEIRIRKIKFRRLLIQNFIIIYKVNIQKRWSLYLTYFSW